MSTTKKVCHTTVSEDAGPKDTASYSSILISEQRYSVEKALDETKDNIRRTIEGARRDIPRNTRALNDCQEQYLKSAREFTDEQDNIEKNNLHGLFIL